MKDVVLIEAASKSTYQRKYKCPYCEQKFERNRLHIHIQNKHEEQIPEGYTALRVAFNTINNKTEGHCIMCGKVSNWNEDKGRYERLCNDPKCHEAYKKMAAERNKNKYGVERLQSDPRYAEEVQRKAMQGRRIAGKYKFTDGGEIEYLGAYERRLLEFMDKVMNCKSEDILAPGPSMNYMYQGKEHLYIPDFYYIPYNLIIEIKDGGDNPNTNPAMRGYKTERQEAKEAAVKASGKYNYIRQTNNDFSQLMSIMAVLKYNLQNEVYDPVMRINEFTLLESQDKSTLDKNFKKKTGIEFDIIDIRNHKVKGNIDELKGKYKDYFKGFAAFEKNTDNFAGFIRIWPNWVMNHWHGNLISPIEVKAKYRGYGLGKLLVEKAIKEYNANLLFVSKDNEIAINMYKNLGFKISDTMKYKKYDQYIMSREGARKVTNESSLLENVIFNRKDIYWNKDKFNSGEINLCFITGHSGSGKSTMGRNLSGEKVDYYELDDLVANYNFSDENLKEYGDLIYSFFKGPGKSYRFTSRKEFESHNFNDRYKDYDIKITKAFIDYSKIYANSHKDRKHVIEGVELFWCIKPEELKDYAVCIKGTSALISMHRAAKRDQDPGILGYLDLMFDLQRLKAYRIYEKDLNKWYNYYSKLINKNESANMNEDMSGTIGAALPLTPSPIPYQSDPDHYLIVNTRPDQKLSYSITKDPLQYTLYSVDPKEEGFYKVFKSDKGKISKNYLTFKIKDKQKAKDLYENLVELYNRNLTFMDHGLQSDINENYIYSYLTDGDNIISPDQILFDTRFELVRSFEESINYESTNLYNYLLHGSSAKDKLDTLSEQVKELEEIIYE